MVLDPRIILAGQPVDAMNALNSGTLAAGNAAEVGRAGDLATLYSQQGPGIMAGETNALNALSRLDPMAGLGVQESRQGMQIREEQLQMARAAAARAAEGHAATMSAAERQREAQVLSQGLSMAIPAIQSGNLDQVNAILAQAELPPVSNIGEAQLLLAQAEGAFEVLQRFNSMQPQQAGPQLENVGGRLYDLSQYDGTQGSLVPLTETQGDAITFTAPDGTTFSMGPSGPQTISGPDAETTPPILNPVEGARDTFGLPSVFQGAANTVADAVGADMPFPQQDEALAQVRLTADAILQELAQGYDRPPLELLRSIRENIPEPGGMFRGPQGAINRYNAIRADLESQLSLESQQRTRTRNPNELSQINRRVSALRNSIARIDRILEGMAPAGAGVSDDDAALMQRYLD